MNMSAKLRKFFLAMAFGICVPILQVEAGDQAVGALYLNAERTSFALISENGARFGIYDIENVPGMVPEPSIGAPAADCSDQQFRCVRFGYKGFAVPRSGLYDKSIYLTGGIRFVVLHCYRHDRNRCIVALVQGDCQTKGADGFCQAAQDGRRTNPGPVTYFIYNRRYGVVAFGSSSETADPVAAEQDARVNVLQGNVGMLHE